MVVVGVDFGNETSVIAVVKKGGIDIVLNASSRRATNSLVSFSGKVRVVGEMSQVTMNPKNTIRQVKRFIGRTGKEPCVAADAAALACNVKAGDDNVSFDVFYDGEQRLFTAEQITSMIFQELRATAEADLNAPCVDCVMSVPCHWTEKQRRALLDAGEIAGLNIMRLVNDTTAAALQHGFFNTQLDEKEATPVLIVDIGHSAVQVSAVSYVKNKVTVLATAADGDLGARDFDGVLFDHFCAEIATKYKLDVKSHKRASARLLAAVEKAKKILSANAQAPLNAECLMNDVDVSLHITREKFEELAAPLLARIAAPVERVLAECGIAADAFSAVEVLGGGSYIPCVQTTLQHVVGRTLDHHMNKSESVAKGCALMGAMLSPAFRVREFEVKDVSYFPLCLTWRTSAAGEGAPETNIVDADAALLERNHSIPCTLSLTFDKLEPFDIFARYHPSATVGEGQTLDVGFYHVDVAADSAALEAPKIKVKVRLSPNGTFSVLGAQLVHTVADAADEMDVVEKKKKEEEGGDGAEEEEKKKKEEGEGEGEGEGAAAEGDGDAKMADGADVQEPEKKKRKKRVKRIDLATRTTAHGLAADVLTAAKEAEFNMQLQDRVVRETNDARNALEAYVYDIRSKASYELADYIKPDDAEKLRADATAMEDWLYGDGEDAQKSVYVKRLEELKKKGEPMQRRKVEEEMRPGAHASLVAAADAWVSLSASTDTKYAHITAEERAQVVAAASDAKAWSADMVAAQSALAKCEDPVVTVSQIAQRRKEMDGAASKLMNRPKPVEKKKEEEKKEEAAGEKKEEEKGGEEAKDGEAMDADPTAPESGGGADMDLD